MSKEINELKKLAKEDIQPLLVSALEENALEFGKVFETLIETKISDIVENYKEVLSHSILSEEGVRDDKYTAGKKKKLNADGTTEYSSDDKKPKKKNDDYKSMSNEEVEVNTFKRITK